MYMSLPSVLYVLVSAFIKAYGTVCKRCQLFICWFSSVYYDYYFSLSLFFSLFNSLHFSTLFYS